MKKVFPYVYITLLPIFKEQCNVEQLIESIKSLNYSESKLDVKLFIEKYNQETLTTIAKIYFIAIL